jgi:1,4-dihydroxy-2-naphthoyl-CoA hydrolase
VDSIVIIFFFTLAFPYFRFMSFIYEYTVQFRDTDAAGVVYFASILSICHIAYEASLIQSGIDLKLFVNNAEFAVPIFHVSADFLRPLFCGDRVAIKLTPQQLDHCRFEISYEIGMISNELLVGAASMLAQPLPQQKEHRSIVSATAISKHIVINPITRKRTELPQPIANWLTEWG